MQDRRLPRRTTIHISGSRRSRGRRRWPGSRRRTSGRLRRSAPPALPPIATPSRRFSTGPTRSPTSPGAARTSTISGRMPSSRAACGGARRRKVSASSSRRGKSFSTSTRSQRRRARIGSGAAPRRGQARTIARSCACRAAAAMRWFCASSILGPGPLSATALSCRKPRARRVGSIPTRCCWPVLGAATSRPRATPGRCGCGGGAPTRRRCRCSSTCRARACRPAPPSIARKRPRRSGSTTRSASST